MADNTILNTGSGGDTIASDDIGGVKYQRVKIGVGANNAANDLIPVSAGLDTAATGVAAVGLVAQLDDAATSTVTEDQFAPVRLSSRRALLVEGVASGTVIPVSDGGGNISIDDGGNVITVDGTVAVTNAGLTSLNGAIAGTEVQVDIVSAPTLTVASHAVTNAGTFATQVDGSALTALQLIDDPVFADDAAFTLASSKVSMAGAVRDDSLSTLTAIEGDAVPLRVSSLGALHVTGGGGGTEYVVNDVAPANPSGTTIVMERDDALSSLTEVEGDWTNSRSNANGALWVAVDGTVTVGSHAVTNAGTFAVQESGTLLTEIQSITHAEDSAHSSTHVGIMPLAVRQDSHVDLAADGDYIPFTIDADGGLRVSVVAGGGSGGTSLADDADFTDGTTAGTPIGGVAESASPTTVTEGDFGWAAITLNRALKVSLYDTAGAALTPSQDATHDSAASTTGPMVMAEFDDTTPDAVDEGDAGRLRMSSNRNLYVHLRDAAGNERGANINASNQLSVTGPVTNAGTFAVQVDGAALTSLQLADDTVFADDAAFTLTTSKVNAIGGIRDDSLSTLSAVEGDVVPFRVSSTGALHVTGGGGGTEYTEDAAAPADPTGATFMMTRDDQLATVTEAEGDWSRPRGTSKGALWVALADSAGDPITSFGGGTQYTEDAAAAANPTGTTLMYVREDARAGSLTTTDGDNVAIRGNNAGEIYVKHTDTIAVTQSGTWDEVGINDSGNSITVDNAQLSVVGSGTEATAMRVTIATDSTGVLSVDDNGGALTVDNGGTFAVQVDGNALTALQLIDNTILVDDAAFTPGTSSVSVIGFQVDEASIDSVDEGDAGAARMTLDRKVIVTPQPHTAGGLSIFRSIDLDETEEDVKTTAGQIYGMWVTNTATSTRFIKIFNATAANVTVGSTTPVITIGIPGNSSDDVSGNFGPGGMGIAFDTAISMAATTGVADADTGAPGSNEVIVNVFYK